MDLTITTYIFDMPSEFFALCLALHAFIPGP